MGLSGFGEPVYLDKMQGVIELKPNGRFTLNLEYFQHHISGDNMLWYNTSPTMGQLFSDKLIDLFEQPRTPNSKIDQHYRDLAASVQAMYEKSLFHILNHAYKLTGNSNLCLAGGCAMNSLANGKIFDKTPFTSIYIPPGACDAGGAIGAAYCVYNQKLGCPRQPAMETAYWGPAYDNEYIAKMLSQHNSELDNLSVHRVDEQEKLTTETAKHLSEGKIVGWFQSRMEWGARALGNRSILADPRKENMRDTINAKIKKREHFRPFAPSVLLEHVSEYFEKDFPDPFMLKVYRIKEDKHKVIPAVTHVDGTGRLQTVSRQNNPLYWQLINSFYKLTGVPVILNTSFNENEPIVCKPEEALDCFLRTNMDILVLGNFVIKRNNQTYNN
jgi:carbamoyltransferase